MRVILSLALLVSAVQSFSVFPTSAFAPGRTIRSVRRAFSSDGEETAEIAEPALDDTLEAPAMSSEPKTLYVGNLNFATEDESLERVFMEFGKVLSAEHVVDRFDPMRKRGFGFVTFENEADADAALDALNGAEVDGRMIRVDFADNKPKGERKPRMEAGGRGGGFNRGGRSDEGRRVYVGNLDYGTSDDILFEVFQEYGEVESCAHLTDRDDPGRKRGFGFVTFSDQGAAEQAVDAMDGFELDGRIIRVRMAEPRPRF